MAKTVTDMVRELDRLPADATVVSFKVVIDTGRMRSTTTYSAALEKKLAKMRASQVGA